MRRSRAISPLLWLVALAFAVAAPAVMVAFGVTQPALIAGSAIVAAFATVLIGGIQQRYFRSAERREEQRITFRDGCLTVKHGRAPLVRDIADLTLLGVHPAVSGATDRIPAYVPRDIDDSLRERIRRGGFVILLGDSAAGKTRAAVEAMQAVIPDFTLIFPLNRGSIPAAIEATNAHPRWVLWLDDLERFLGPDGLTEARLVRLLATARPEHLILATMRSAEYARYSNVDDATGRNMASVEAAREIRNLVGHADLVTVSRRLSARELSKAASSGDTRIADALDHSARYGLGEYLTAGPECLALWQSGWGAGVHPRGAALVAAAVDARRAGITHALPRDLIQELHTHYLRRRGGSVLRPEALDVAWEWATQARHGTTGMLTVSTAAEDMVEAFDYLVDSVERNPKAEERIPGEVLTRLIRIAEPAELTRIAHSAFDAGHHAIAKEAYLAALRQRRDLLGHDHPDTISSLHSFAYSLAQLGRHKEARSAWQELVETYTRLYGPDHELVLRSREGLAGTLDPEARERELRQLLATFENSLPQDHPYVRGCRSDLGEVLEELGRHDEARVIRQRMLDDALSSDAAGSVRTSAALHGLAFLLTSVGRLEEGEARWREVIDRYLMELGADHPLTLRARHGLAWTQAERGLVDEARLSLEAIVADYQRTTGPDHPWASSCVSYLAGLG